MSSFSSQYIFNNNILSSLNDILCISTCMVREFVGDRKSLGDQEISPSSMPTQQ